MEVLRALRIANYEAVSSTAHASLTGGAFQTGFALWLGAGNFWMGVIGAVPTFSALVQMASSVWVERLGERKRMTAWFALASRSLWLPILLIPWLLPHDLRLFGFLVLFTLSSLAIQVPAPAHTSWLSDLAPPDHRGRYFARRNMLAGLTTLVATLPTAWFLDRAISSHVVPHGTAFAVLFAIGVAFGVVSFLLIRAQPEPPMATVARPDGAAGGGSFRAPLHDRAFRRLLAFSAAFAVGQFFAAPFYTVYALEDLRLSYMWLQVLGGVASVAALLSMPLWGYLGDKFGSKPLLGLAVAGVSLTPLPWLAANPRNLPVTLVILCLNNVAGGVFWGGVGLLQFNLLIETTPAEGRGLYVGVLSALTGIAGGIAPVVGGALVEALRAHPIVVAGVVVGSYQTVFALNAVIRALTLPLLRSVPTASSATALKVLEQLGSVRVRTLRHIRQLQHSGDERERQDAVNALSLARSGIAVQELTLALSDPSPDVRRRAAAALGDIRDPTATPALAGLVGDEDPAIAVEAIEALGRIGDPTAAPALANALESAERGVIVAAARALGRMGAREAAGPLVATLKQALASESSDVVEAVAAALGRCGDAGVAPKLVELLEHADRSVRSSAVQALGDLGDPSSGDALVSVVASTADAGLRTRAAVALAKCGHTPALPHLYEALAGLESIAARRQVANAIGALVGDPQTYRLLASDPMARELAIVRRIRGAGRLQGDEQGSSRRRALLMERAAQAYAEGELRSAGALILRGAQRDNGPIGKVLEMARSRLRAHDPTEEEFIAILAAVASADRQREADGA